MQLYRICTAGRFSGKVGSGAGDKPLIVNAPPPARRQASSHCLLDDMRVATFTSTRNSDRNQRFSILRHFVCNRRTNCKMHLLFCESDHEHSIDRYPNFLPDSVCVGFHLGAIARISQINELVLGCSFAPSPGLYNLLHNELANLEMGHLAHAGRCGHLDFSPRLHDRTGIARGEPHLIRQFDSRSV